MNCDFVKEKIYEWVYANIKQIDDELIRHIVDCPDCKSYYEDCRSAKKITTLLGQKQPVLNDPQKLTKDILDTLNELEPEKQSAGFRIFVAAKRFLVAASVSLFIVFGYEQYVVIGKMIELEEQMSVVPVARTNSNQYRQIMSYYPDQGIELIKSKLASRVFDSQGNDLKTLFMVASLSVVSPDRISKRLQDRLVHLAVSNVDTSVINTTEKDNE